MPDRGSAGSLNTTNQSLNMPDADCQYMRRCDNGHAAINDFRQNLDPLQIALAHGEQSHLHLPDVNQVRGV
ncbi:hypothetical protein D3C71_1167800 [compost metagenome]